MPARSTLVTVLLSFLGLISLATTSRAGNEKQAVALEVRFFTVTTATWDKMTDWNAVSTLLQKKTPELVPSKSAFESLKTAQEPGAHMAILDDELVKALYVFAQGDRSLQVMQMPGKSVLNGKNGAHQFTEKLYFLTNDDSQPKLETKDLGVVAEWLPKITDDKRSVQLTFDWNYTSLANGYDLPAPITLPTTTGKDGGSDFRSHAPVYPSRPSFDIWAFQVALTIPDGKTALIGFVQHPHESSPRKRPVWLSILPFWCDFIAEAIFVDDEPQTTSFVLVTPRIVAASAVK